MIDEGWIIPDHVINRYIFYEKIKKKLVRLDYLGLENNCRLIDIYTHFLMINKNHLRINCGFSKNR